MTVFKKRLWLFVLLWKWSGLCLFSSAISHNESKDMRTKWGRNQERGCDIKFNCPYNRKKEVVLTFITTDINVKKIIIICIQKQEVPLSCDTFLSWQGLSIMKADVVILWNSYHANEAKGQYRDDTVQWQQWTNVFHRSSTTLNVALNE